MGELNAEAGTIQGKIVYFGAAGSGMTQNARQIHRKLKREHRGELRVLEVRGHPKATYEYLPVQLGAVRGLQTAIQIYTVPSGAEHAAERRRILDDVDGIVFVADLRPASQKATVDALAELRGHLTSYGRSLEDVVLVVQYNHKDEAGENDLERLHRALALRPAGFFEAIAPEGTGVLQTLTTLSKLVLGKLRQQHEAEPGSVKPEKHAVAHAVAPPPAAREAEAAKGLPQARLEEPLGADDLAIEVSGAPELREGGLSLPLRIVERETGRKVEFRLRVNLEP